MADSITYGLTSLKNENILTLSNLNLDFSIVKFVPPPEYNGLGLSLSPLRKKEAEDGTTHTVARKLALLLCHDLPDIPHLIKAYGKRASEIAENPSVNPQGSPLDGVFQDHVGLDATSLWASATSGKNTVALHLLACMLARIWKSKAVSVWVEIVERRKAALRARLDGDLIRSDDVTASAVQISREQLAEWDSSARAWLQSADVGFVRQQKQLMLILDNCNVGIAPSGDTLSAVVEAWKVALQFMESVVAGQPMAVRSGEVLLAMSSWHLYPDLEVLGNKPTSIRQKDPLITPGGIVTIGLETPNVEDQFGVSWSLPLSHLRYYGKSVLSTGSVNYSGSRVPMGHLLTVALGSAIGSWARTAQDVEVFANVLELLKDNLSRQGTPIPEWFSLLLSTCTAYRDASGESRSEIDRLFEFGRRRGAKFLSKKGQDVPPWLGLSDPFVVARVLKGSEAKVGFLRGCYERVWKKKDSSRLEHAIIRYKTSPGETPKKEEAQDEGGQASMDDHAIMEHIYHPDHKSLRTTSDDDQWEFASLAPVYAGTDGKPSHRRWIPGFMPPPPRTSCRYVPMATSAALRFKHLNLLGTESVTLLPDGHVSKIIKRSPWSLLWCSDHTESQPSQILRGWNLDSDPGAVAEDSEPAAGPPRGKLFESLSSFAWPTPWMAPSRHPQGPLLEEIHRIETALNGAKLTMSALQDVVLSTPTTRNSGVFSANSSDGGVHNKPPPSSGATSWTCYSLRPGYISLTDCVYSWYVPVVPPESGKFEVYERVLPQEAADVAVYLHEKLIFGVRMAERLSPRDLLHNLAAAGPIDAGHLFSLWPQSCNEWMDSLAALWQASELYRGLPGALVELSTIKIPLNHYMWARRKNNSSRANSLAERLACIATFETGYLNIDPATLRDVMGISTGNSLYISCLFSSDPVSSERTVSTIGRCVGNIGKPGVAFLVSPENPNMKEAGFDRWSFVQHAPFEGALEDNFSETSLHLSFTGYKQPLFTGEHGLRDTEVYFLQSVVQVYDKGNWVADVDILRALVNAEPSSLIKRLSGGPGQQSQCEHSGDRAGHFSSLGTVKSIDCWDEIIDQPDGISIARAKGNRLARLALSVVAFQKNKQVIILDTSSSSICWACVKATVTKRDAIIIC